MIKKPEDFFMLAQPSSFWIKSSANCSFAIATLTQEGMLQKKMLTLLKMNFFDGMLTLTLESHSLSIENNMPRISAYNEW